MFNLQTKQAMKRKIILIFMLVAFLLFISPRIFAVNSTTVSSRVNVTNVAPSIVSITVNRVGYAPGTNIDLIPGTITPVECNGTINDTNGYADILNASAVFYDNSVATPTSSDNNETHYTNSSCTLSAGSGLSKNFHCYFGVLYYANNASWTCNVTAYDADGAYNSSTNSTNINILVALNVSNTTIDYGNMAPLETSSSSVIENITNHGNVKLDLTLNGTDMTCPNPYPAIPVGNQHYNVTGTDQAYELMTALTSSPVTVTAFDLLKRNDTDALRAIRMTYWRISIPAGLKGVCQGNITFAVLVG
ncbi:MAG: hypothetical protein ACP5OZ_05175 [Candidatus Woesearchaeota archaeon]